jgi:surface protein
MSLGIGVPFNFNKLGGGGGTPPSSPDFISTWDTTQAGSASDTIVLPMTAGNTVHWGDGNTDTTNTHTYASGGTYTITIEGAVTTFRFNNSGDRRKITDVSNWGGFDISNTSIFRGCSNLDVSATDAPTVTTTDLSNTFKSCTSLSNPNLSSWDVSGVLKLGASYQQGIFTSCTSLVNPDLSGWDTSNVTHMYAVFYNCSNFNSPSISNWDVSSVLYFGNNADWATFGLCTSFNQPLNWSINTVGSVNMSYMFYGCTAFNQYLDWDVSHVTSMKAMFRSCTSFDQNIGSWNTGAVTTMTEMFQSATNFNNGGSPDIDNWDVSSVTIFGGAYNAAMFLGATSFNQPIGNWDTSAMTQAIAMFSGASSFNQPIGTWNTSNLIYAGGTSQTNWGMFYNATAFDQDISAWDVNQITRLSSFMSGVTLSTANYDALLIAWDAQGAMSFSGTVNFGGSQYTSGGAAETARTSLIAKWGAITDGGAA